MKRKFLSLLMVAVLVLSMKAFAAANEVTGRVTLAVPSGELAEIRPVLDVFEQRYPNVELQVEPLTANQVLSNGHGYCRHSA